MTKGTVGHKAREAALTEKNKKKKTTKLKGSDNVLEFIAEL